MQRRPHRPATTPGLTVAIAAAILASTRVASCTKGAMPTLDSTPPLVLIASDQEWSGRSLETIIGPRGYAVVRAHTGQQVLETVRTTHVDLLILDTRLPDVDGIQLCRRLREQRIVSGHHADHTDDFGAGDARQQHRRLRRGRVGLLSAPRGRRPAAVEDGQLRSAKRAADRAQEESLLDESTGLYNFRGMARRARETGAEALRVRGAMACVALAPVMDDAVEAESRSRPWPRASASTSAWRWPAPRGRPT